MCLKFPIYSLSRTRLKHQSVVSNMSCCGLNEKSGFAHFLEEFPVVWEGWLCPILVRYGQDNVIPTKISKTNVNVDVHWSTAVVSLHCEWNIDDGGIDD